MQGIKDALEELNFITTACFTDQEFKQRFKVHPNSNSIKLELDKTFYISKQLKVEHSELVIDIINLAKSKQFL